SAVALPESVPLAPVPQSPPSTVSISTPEPAQAPPSQGVGAGPVRARYGQVQGGSGMGVGVGGGRMGMRGQGEPGVMGTTQAAPEPGQSSGWSQGVRARSNNTRPGLGGGAGGPGSMSGGGGGSVSAGPRCRGGLSGQEMPPRGAVRARANDRGGPSHEEL